MQGIWLVGLPLVSLGTVKIASLYVWNIITLYTLAVRPVILAEAFLFFQFNGLPQCGSGSYTLSFQNRAVSEIAGQPMWDLL